MNKLKNYKERHGLPIKQATICLLLRDGEILLAMKKRGFGVGKWNGVGGKPNQDEAIEEAAIRETGEEILVTPKNLTHVALLNFYNEDNPALNDQQVHVYIVKDWDGDPTETEEMAPKWFKLDEIPYDQMWEDDQHWFPLVLAGKKIQGDFLFGEGDNLIEFRLEEQ